jgi:hypothetical protein
MLANTTYCDVHWIDDNVEHGVPALPVRAA